MRTRLGGMFQPAQVELPISGPIGLVGMTRYSLRLYFWTAVGHQIVQVHYLLGIEGPFSVVIGGAATTVDPSSGPDPVYLRFVEKVVLRATATKRGDLHTKFADGDTLNVAAVTKPVGEGGFEPWILEGDDGYSAISIAGGGLSVSTGPAKPGSLDPI